MPSIAWGSEEKRNFEECSERNYKNFVTQQKLCHDDTLIHTESLFNFLEQEDKTTPAEKKSCLEIWVEKFAETSIKNENILL